MTQGDDRWDAMTDEQFVAWYVEQHGFEAAAAMAKFMQLPSPKQGPKPWQAKKAGVRVRTKRRSRQTRRADSFDVLRHGEPPPRLPSHRKVKAAA